MMPGNFARDDDDGSDWPPHARSDDPETSHISAERINPTHDVKLIVRHFVTHDRPSGWIRSELQRADAVLRAVDERNNGLSKRLSDAKNMGLVAQVRDPDTDEPVKRDGEYGVPQEVYRVTETGRQWINGKIETPARQHRSRKPKAVELDPAEIAAIDKLRVELEGKSLGGWVVIEAGHARALLALLERLGAK